MAQPVQDAVWYVAEQKVRVANSVYGLVGSDGRESVLWISELQQ
jgi:hypothetical protein